MNIVKRIKLGFKENKCYSMMCCGPSGVGKTLTAKTFAKNLVGKNVIRLDMTEYIEPHSVSKLIGPPPGYVGYQDNTNILEEIKIAVYPQSKPTNINYTWTLPDSKGLTGYIYDTMSFRH